MSLHITIIAGESSGDEIGKILISALKKLRPDIRFSGVSGPSMKAVDTTFDSWLDISSFQTLGLFDVLQKITTILQARKKIVEKIASTKPDLILCIDQPSFSKSIAKAIRARLKNSFCPPIVQVVAPSVWAYNPKRARDLKKYFDELFILYHFEKPFFTPHIPTLWIGHPALYRLKNPSELPKEPLIALYPGSRPKEIERNLPFQLDLIEKLMKYSETPYSVAIQLPNTLTKKRLSWIEQNCHGIFLNPFEARDTLMKRARFAIAKSGTITLELALSKTPMITIYQLGFFTRLWAKYILKVSTNQLFSLPNILLRKKLFPEFVGIAPDFQTVLDESKKLLQQPPEALITTDDLRNLHKELFPQELSPGFIAAQRSLELIEEFQHKSTPSLCIAKT